MNIDKEILEILSERYGFSEEEILLALEEYDEGVQSVFLFGLSNLTDIIDNLCYVGNPSDWYEEHLRDFLIERNVEELQDCIDKNKFMDTFLSDYTETEHCVWKIV